MEIRPIISALMRSKVALILIGLQIALTLAVVCNALFIINERIERTGRPSGMNETDTFMVSSSGFGADFNVKTTIAEDLAALRGLPGVRAVAPINSVPMNNSGWGMGASLTPDQKVSNASAAYYFVDEHGLDAYGLNLIAGRNFKADEITTRDRNSDGWTASLIISKALADKLFPGEDAIGKQFYVDQKQKPRTVVGVVERMQVPWPGFAVRNDPNSVEYSMLVPQILASGKGSTYLVRTEPGGRDELMKTAEKKLMDSNHGRIVRSLRSIEQVRSNCYRSDRAMMIILGIVIVCLLTITALGIVGMASFWVTQRTKQIGTRRALGATRGSILRYFLTENFLITSGGLILGAVLAYAFSFWLMSHYQARLLPWHYVPIGFLCLWALGQLAVLGPATRASRVPPAVATRSV